MSAAGCFGKIGYPTRAEAESVRDALRKRRHDEGTQMPQVYHCDACGRFHLGRNVRAGRPERVKAADHFRAKYRRWLELTRGGQ